YRTLVLRRSPAESRPPSIYRLVWLGRRYEVWQRAEAPEPIADHLPLGDVLQPGGVPFCDDVRRLALEVPGGRLVAPARRPVAVADLARVPRPASWPAGPAGSQYVFPASGGSLEAAIAVPAAGRYDVWVGGSFR